MTGTQDMPQLQADIDETRRELGETVEALAAKTNVRAQAKRKLDGAKAAAMEKKHRALTRTRGSSPAGVAVVISRLAQEIRTNPLPAAAAGALFAGIVIGRSMRR